MADATEVSQAELLALSQRCSRCRTVKPGTEFWVRRKQRRRTGGIQLTDVCKPCSNEQNAEWRAANPERDRRNYRRRWLRKNYGLTLERYEELVAQQGGVCAICSQPPAGRELDVDHCHKTGEVRALLCSRCNRVLGHAGDDPDLLQAIVDYLLRFPVGI